jgi:hypothetical protein
MVELGSQQIEILGRNRLKAALIEAGLEVATPERDNGIDLIMYRWSAEGGEFVARPVQMKAATEFTFSVDRKYERIPTLVIAYVMNARGGDHAIYAMTYPEAAEIADRLGWTKTKSWEDGGQRATVVLSGPGDFARGALRRPEDRQRVIEFLRRIALRVKCLAPGKQAGNA